MSFANKIRWVLVGVSAGVLLPRGIGAQPPGMPDDVTFARDIAPILQRSCQNCHRPDGVAPMSLVTYEEVRPWARSIKLRTGLGPRAGVMPPWYIEKNIGIQKYKNDPSLSAAEIATVAKWPTVVRRAEIQPTPRRSVSSPLVRAHGRSANPTSWYRRRKWR